MDRSNDSDAKLGREQSEVVYTDLEILAEEIEKTLTTNGDDLEFYRTCPQLLSELRSLMSELMQTKSGNKLSQLLYRFLELEGKVKEMRNDLVSRNEPHRS